MRGFDAVLTQIPGGLYDIQIGFDGDILTEDAFDTAIIVLLFTDARANESEVLEADRRRGWIGDNAIEGFSTVSKLWLYSQARLTQTTLNKLADAARVALEVLVEQGLAVAITDVSVRVSGQSAFLDLTIKRSASVVESRTYEIWNNTGV